MLDAVVTVTQMPVTVKVTGKLFGIYKTCLNSKHQKPV